MNEKDVLYKIEEYLNSSEESITREDLQVLMNYIDELRLKLNKITEVVRRKPVKTNDDKINYQNAMAQLESIIYILKGLA